MAVIENDLLQSLIKEGLLAEIDYRQAPNFRNVVADFRDLTFDPSNRHSAPYTWGTTGLLVRSDLVESPVTRWADLWDQRYAGKIAVRAQPTELISVALKSLGYPLNSEDPQALEAALQRLIDLKSSVMFVDVETHYAIANEAARAFIKPEIAGDTTFYPPKEIIQRANWYLPLSPAGQKLYDDIWERFMTAGK